MTSDGSLIFDGTMRRPPTTHLLRPGVFSPYQSTRHSRAVGPASGAPPFNQSLQQDELLRALALGIQPTKRPNFFTEEPGIERPEQGLQDVRPQFAYAIGHFREQRAGREQEGLAGAIGRGKSHGAAIRASPATRRGRRAARATRAYRHTIAEDRRRRRARLAT